MDDRLYRTLDRVWEVAGELRKRLKKAFDQEGIKIPRPYKESCERL